MEDRGGRLPGLHRRRRQGQRLLRRPHQRRAEVEGDRLKTVLFLCSGNYFRSRFAEALFNQLAAAGGLGARARSAGLEPQCHTRNPGPLSPHTIAGLRSRGIEVTAPRPPCDVTPDELAAADLIVAVKEAEHRPLLERRFPGWTERVRYWHVDDLPLAAPPDALAQLEALVRALVDELRDAAQP